MKDTFIIIGEGPTEYFFLTSLKDEFRTLQNIDPQYPKHTSTAELELKIKKAIEQGYNRVYCMIDLDNKKEGKEKTRQTSANNVVTQRRQTSSEGILCTSSPRSRAA